MKKLKNSRHVMSNKIGFLGLFALFTFIFVTAESIFPEQEEQKSINESVNVTNIEIPVRVLHQGKMVDGLTREDFKIFEGKTQKQLNGFYINRKNLKVPKILSDASLKEALPIPRYFVLVFRIHEMNKKIKEGVQYVFNSMLNKNDHLLIIADQETLFFNNLLKKEETISQVLTMLEAQGRKGLQRRRNLMKRISNTPIFGTEDDERADNYLKSYMEILQDYREKHLKPEMESLYNFARHLEAIHLEKWIINFYQEETYPHLSRNTKAWIYSIIETMMVDEGHQSQNSKIIHRKLMRIETALNAATDFPLEVIQKLFVKTGATFHTILIPTSKPPNFQYYDGFFNWGFEYKRLSTDFENSIREITKKTGGSLISSKDLVASIKNLEKSEDICYWLTFAPGDSNKIGKIKIEIRDPRYKLLYDDKLSSYFLEQFVNKRNDPGKGIRLDRVNISDRTLHIRITGNQIIKQVDDRLVGIFLRIRLKDNQNQDILDHQKILIPSKETIQISIPLKKITPGKYFALVQIKDLSTGKGDFQLLETRL